MPLTPISPPSACGQPLADGKSENPCCQTPMFFISDAVDEIARHPGKADKPFGGIAVNVNDDARRDGRVFKERY